MGQINVEKSIQTRRLHYYNNSWEQVGRWAERVPLFLISLLFIVFPMEDILEGLNVSNLPISRIISNSIFITFGILMLYGSINIDKLSVIQGRLKATNRDLMLEVMKSMFQDCKFYFVEEQLYGQREWTLLIPGKELIVLFDANNIYINITHKVRLGSMSSPFHVLKNQIDIREIKKRVSHKMVIASS